MSPTAIRAVEFSNGGINLESLLPKIEHTQRKFVNFEDFEDWTNGHRGASLASKNQSFSKFKNFLMGILILRQTSF